MKLAVIQRRSPMYMVTLRKALAMNRWTSVWEVTCHRCLLAHNKSKKEANVKKERGMCNEGYTLRTERNYLNPLPLLCPLPTQKAEWEGVKRYVEHVHKRVLWVCSVRLCHVVSNSGNNLHHQNSPVVVLRFSVVVFLKSGAITMIASVWSGYNERGYFFLCATKY